MLIYEHIYVHTHKKKSEEVGSPRSRTIDHYEPSSLETEVRSSLRNHGFLTTKPFLHHPSHCLLIIAFYGNVHRYDTGNIIQDLKRVSSVVQLESCGSMLIKNHIKTVSSLNSLQPHCVKKQILTVNMNCWLY